MKILYDYQQFTMQKYGGISRYLYEIITRIGKYKADEVKVLAGLYINQYLKNCDSGLVIGWQSPKIPKTGKMRKLVNYYLSRFWLSTHDKPDIIHETYYASKSVMSQPCPTVITVHDMIHEKLNSFLSDKAKRLSLVKVNAINRADHVICVSNQTKKDLIEIFKIDPKKITVIYHGYSFDIKDYQMLNVKIIKSPYILYLGLREGYKNFDRLLQAFASRNKLKNNFKLVCAGAKKFSTLELDRIVELGLTENNIKYVPADDQTIAQLYNGASVFVYPSLYEGFGIPPLEAMAFSCPVACSRVSSIPEVVDNAAEFFDPYNIDSIADALEQVLFSSEKNKTLIRLGKERLKHFSWDTCAQKTYSVYSSLMS